MLNVLFGSKNVSKVLIFLFVNEKCYGTQLHRALKVPLTPLQKALLRLEKGGIISSLYEGKTRIYQFNPAYPLLEELELLLKKAYTRLSPQEKKQYCFVKQEMRYDANQSEHAQILLLFWERLLGVKELTFHAKTKSKQAEGWNGKGRGEVAVTVDGLNVLIFHEKGSWKDKNGQVTDFSNVFRWTFDRMLGTISLEHLRRGVHHPVFLFHLVPIEARALISVDSHLCGGDTYFGWLSLDQHCLRLNWRVIGPQKNEEIDYYYLN
jgi:hypothetical protein